MHKGKSPYSIEVVLDLFKLFGPLGKSPGNAAANGYRKRKSSMDLGVHFIITFYYESVPKIYFAGEYFMFHYLL